MTDLTKTIIPKSDQLNADDLIAGEKTIVITKVSVVAGEQPVSIHYEGGDGKPWKPCKSMLRILIHAWGKDGDKYIGRSVRLFSDPTVKWAGDEVGGIRISHMSDIDGELNRMLTTTRGRRSPYTVKPLITTPLNQLADEAFESFQTRINAADSMAALGVIGEEIKRGQYDKDSAAKVAVIYKAAVKRIRSADGQEVR